MQRNDGEFALCCSRCLGRLCLQEGRTLFEHGRPTRRIPGYQLQQGLQVQVLPQVFVTDSSIFPDWLLRGCYPRGQ
ncbi:unnamed protein product [Durusdinium trenchii]|uniref:Uncharacterized protein n=1 Tax=Durusdinium trenchii TaxID=1381693 RepID=A0ABP0S0X1_9DINO